MLVGTILPELLKLGLDQSESEKIFAQIRQLPTDLPSDQRWRHISKKVLNKNHPIKVHRYLHHYIYQDWNTDESPIPVWTPGKNDIKNSNIYRLMQEKNISSYNSLYNWSITDKPSFWRKMIDLLNIQFKKPYSEIVDLKDGVTSPNWLSSAELNIVDSCFRAADDAQAVVFQPEGDKVSAISYRELELLVNRIANSLIKEDIKKGDYVGIDMPMTLESVAIYLACLKVGAVVVTIADSFAVEEIKVRLQIADVSLVLTQDYLLWAGKRLPLYARVKEAYLGCVIVIRTGDADIGLRDQDLVWETFLSENDQFESVTCSPSDYCTILFSSGTTGVPKAIPWTHTTAIKAASDAYLHHDVKEGECLCWPTNLGWMMGPWLVFASLINQSSMALYYGTPTTNEFSQFVGQVEVNMLGLVPSLVSHWRAIDCIRQHDWSKIKVLSSTGECSNPEDMFYLMAMVDYKPIIEYCGGTEIGGGYITGSVVQPTVPACFSTPALGSELVILDANHEPVDNGEVFLLPPAMGLSTELLNQDHHQVYYGHIPPYQNRICRRHGDQMERLPGNYFRAHGRFDDSMNLSGIKVSSNQIEGVLNRLDFVKESAAVAVAPKGGGPSNLIIYVVARDGCQLKPTEMQLVMQEAIRRNLNPLFKISDLRLVEFLPRTASNKVMRRQLRQDYV
ncbi:TPA: AMP-dependent synthetase [Candidatus Poribacteria bacterium]|nr:AMP-dependent synthetase [Candidatus Poribacteria bacterium]HIB89127.1 AMP-dependent synthetase [Candidatus Poribacteria bacterium]HIC02687.1 AMP-dependent synthetase [Candidatus Poribacteria bacterium]HIN27479.1 AMP-dependent synthetase [Candidatus Poribacteria bacterium]HIO09819.1 AMP-dependent synthetase [Candidatus Poribacteria bacterium]